jgi:hypothetical protein
MSEIRSHNFNLSAKPNSESMHALCAKIATERWVPVCLSTLGDDPAAAAFRYAEKTSKETLVTAACSLGAHTV